MLEKTKKKFLDECRRAFDKVNRNGAMWSGSSQFCCHRVRDLLHCVIKDQLNGNQ